MWWGCYCLVVCDGLVLFCFFFFFKQKTAYEILAWLEFRRVLFRSDDDGGDDDDDDGDDDDDNNDNNVDDDDDDDDDYNSKWAEIFVKT